MNTRGRIVTSWFAALVGTTACLDMRDVPVTIRAASRDGGVSLADAGSTGEDGGIPMSPCNQCILAEDGPCRPDFDGCSKSAKCRMVVLCAAQRRCLEVADFGEVYACAQFCLDQAEITSSNDPAIAGAVPLFYCTRDPARCGNVCSN